MTAQFMEQPAEWDRSDWLAWRRAGCGGSDVAAICGLSTFGSPMSVFYDKTLGIDEPDNDAMRWGRVLEPVIAEQFTVDTDLHVIAPQLLVWDDAHPWRRCTLDGLVAETNIDWGERAIRDGDTPLYRIVLGTFEAKTDRDYSWDDGIPDRVSIQTLWQMGIAELEHCWLACLHANQKFRVYELEFDPVAFAKLAEIVDRFWLSNVVAECPPPPDSNPATTAALKGAWNDRATDDVIQLDNYVAARALDWIKAKAALQEAKDWVEGIENDLRATLCDASFGAIEDVEWLSWKAQRVAGRLDEKALREAEPDVYAKFKKPDGVTRVLRATKALRALAEGVDA